MVLLSRPIWLTTVRGSACLSVWWSCLHPTHSEQILFTTKFSVMFVFSFFLSKFKSCHISLLHVWAKTVCFKNIFSFALFQFFSPLRRNILAVECKYQLFVKLSFISRLVCLSLSGRAEKADRQPRPFQLLSPAVWRTY